MVKISGTWFEFQHHSTVEGKYWNSACAGFTANQWREKVREIAGADMKYIVLMATALRGQAYFETDIFPKAPLACEDPIGALLSQADESGLQVFLGVGFYGDWTQPLRNMTDMEIVGRELRAMEQLAERYGGHRSLYGWYFPDETCIAGHFSDEFLRYVDVLGHQAETLGRPYKTLIAPFGTRLVKADTEYIRQLERLHVDFVAYQDEVGVRKTRLEESAGFYRALKKAHDRAGRSRLWADVELFEFEGEPYRSALLPAGYTRIKKQLEAVAPYVEETLAYQYLGLMNRPGTAAFAGHPSSEKFYVDYTGGLAGRMR